MKKIIIVGFIVTMLLMINDQESIVIPQDAIRFRIIANSNNIEDQLTKMNIKKEVISFLKMNEEKIDNYDNTKAYLIDSKTTIENIISAYQIDYNVKIGSNYFPQKNYRGVSYPSGEYESMIITIGKGLGDNWWCVLYPPLCFIDEEQEEYKSLVKEIIDNI